MVPPSAVAVGDEVDPQAPSRNRIRLIGLSRRSVFVRRRSRWRCWAGVNPLALEEFTAMEERHTFLNTQLEDLKRSRKDLLDIVAEVDERVQQVFAEAFADVQSSSPVSLDVCSPVVRSPRAHGSR